MHGRGVMQDPESGVAETNIEQVNTITPNSTGASLRPTQVWVFQAEGTEAGKESPEGGINSTVQNQLTAANASGRRERRMTPSALGLHTPS